MLNILKRPCSGVDVNHRPAFDLARQDVDAKLRQIGKAMQADPDGDKGIAWRKRLEEERQAKARQRAEAANQNPYGMDFVVYAQPL